MHRNCKFIEVNLVKAKWILSDVYSSYQKEKLLQAISMPKTRSCTCSNFCRLCWPSKFNEEICLKSMYFSFLFFIAVSQLSSLKYYGNIWKQLRKRKFQKITQKYFTTDFFWMLTLRRLWSKNWRQALTVN